VAKVSVVVVKLLEEDEVVGAGIREQASEIGRAKD
jgi:hypothetical protein